MKVIADRQIPFLNGVLEPYADVVYLDGEAIRAADVADADALLVRTRTACVPGLLAESKVRFIGTATIGKDHIDTAWCDFQKIFWTNAPGCNADAVCQYLVATLLSISVKHGIPLQGKIIGIVGVGAVGSRVARACTTLGMKVLLHDPPRAAIERKLHFDSIATLQQQSDFLTFHTPLEKTGRYPTWRMVNSSFLNKLKPDAWIINTSRGAVVDNTSLRIALRSNSIAGAVLDVWEGEPDSIDLDLLPLLELATPHIAGYSIEGKARATTMVVQAFAKYFSIDALREWAVPTEALGAVPGKLLQVNAEGISAEEALLQAVRASYDILADDGDLRADPSQFEMLRSRYAFRREFPAFKVVLENAPAALRNKFLGLGFQLV